MDTEFHYWLTALIASRAGFKNDEAETIAYSSEYVDENDFSIAVEDRKAGKPKDVYKNVISQTMNILKPGRELMRIYPIFHFIPGEPDAPSARRLDGKMHPFNTTSNSGNANELFDEALKASDDTRLYRIGIATHSYVDTWAHQNFVGYYDHFNNIGFDPKPDIGHADAEHHPDWVAHRWEDIRLVDSHVSNTHRFLSASEALYRKYCDYLSKQTSAGNVSNWNGIKKELISLFGVEYSGSIRYYEKERMEAYKEKLGWLEDFDEMKWFKRAIRKEVKVKRPFNKQTQSPIEFIDKYYWRDDVDKENNDWFRFQEAVKEHSSCAIKLLRPTFAKMGYNI